MKILEQIFGKRIADQITPQSDREYNNLLLDCIREVTEKNAVLVDRYGIGHVRWDLDQEIGDLVFSDNGIPKVKAKVVVAGTYSLEFGTWLWGWANTSILKHLTNDALRVKTYGELHGIPDLVERKTEATEGEAWGFAALSCRILDGKGVYMGPAGNTYVFMVMTQIDILTAGTK